MTDRKCIRFEKCALLLLGNNLDLKMPLLNDIDVEVPEGGFWNLI